MKIAKIKTRDIIISLKQQVILGTPVKDPSAGVLLYISGEDPGGGGPGARRGQKKIGQWGAPPFENSWIRPCNIHRVSVTTMSE